MDDDVDDMSLELLLLESIAWWKLERGEPEQATESTIRLSGEQLVDLAKLVNDLSLQRADDYDGYHRQCRERLGAYCLAMRQRWPGRSPY